MKKVVIISSSPRKHGNSTMLCRQFEKGAKEAGHEVEIVYLSDYKMAPCMACDYCHSHNNQCVIKDDADIVIQKMIDADVWVLSSPVYFYSVTAQMKLLMDRFFAREYEIRDNEKRKDVNYIVTSGAPTIDDLTGTMETLRGFVKVMRKVDEKGVIDGAGAFKIGDAKEHPAFNQAYEMGKNI